MIKVRIVKRSDACDVSPVAMFYDLVCQQWRKSCQSAKQALILSAAFFLFFVCLFLFFVFVFISSVFVSMSIRMGLNVFSLFVFLKVIHSDQISQGSQVPGMAPCEGFSTCRVC